jgi:peptidoglycan L-alanyl-D-glutamate endopeptidase CwlK
MRPLSKVEQNRYITLCPDLQLVFDETRKELEINPRPLCPDIFLVCGERAEKEQNDAVRKGLSKVKYPFSTHNKKPSEGLDTCPFPIDWKDVKRFKVMYDVMKMIADRLFAEGKIRKIRFGADFNQDGNLTNDKFVDMPHCEVVQL